VAEPSVFFSLEHAAVKHWPLHDQNQLQLQAISLQKQKCGHVSVMMKQGTCE